MIFYRISHYGLEVQWTLMWFPVKASAQLDRPRIRAGSFRHSSNEEGLNDPGIGSGTTVIHLLGQALAPGEEALAPPDLVLGFIGVRLTHDGLFEVDTELDIGPLKRQQRFVVRPDMRVPFMLTAQAGASHEARRDTGAVLHGVAAAGSLISLLDATSVVKLGEP